MATKTLPQREKLTMLQEQKILEETIAKEMRSHQLCTNFTINPFTKMEVVTGKVNSYQEAELNEIKGDEQMKEVIKRSRIPPTQKNIFPQTSSQEYGWISAPLIDLDRSDTRLHFARNACEITKTREVQWSKGAK